MSVKKATGTTISLIVLVVGTIYLIPIIISVLPYRAFFPLDARAYSHYPIGGYYPFSMKATIWIIVGVGILDAILRRKVAFGLLSSLNIPIIMSIPIIITEFIPQASFYIFWVIMQITAIVGIYWSFRKIIRNNHPYGQKLFSFIKKSNHPGAERTGHVSDHYVVWGVSLLLFIVYIILIIAFLFFMITHWGMFI